MQRTLQLWIFLSEMLLYDVRIAEKKISGKITTKFKSFIAETF